MKIALCIKQVPDTTDIKWSENNTLQREGVESVINPYDIYAAELALKIKNETENSKITVFTMGPAQAEEALRKILALGCDDAVLISDKKFAGADTYATGKTISSAIKTVLPDFDLVVCGQFAVDGDTAQTGPSIANFLNVPQVTFVQDFVKRENEKMIFTKILEDGIETVEVKLPAVICVMTQYFEPKRAFIKGIIEASDKTIRTISMEDCNLQVEEVGLKGSPTYVSRAFRNTTSHKPEKHKCDKREGAVLLQERLDKYGGCE